MHTMDVEEASAPKGFLLEPLPFRAQNESQKLKPFGWLCVCVDVLNAEGKPVLVILAGAPGSGKSTFCEEVIRVSTRP